jgi:hypothetical protein
MTYFIAIIVSLFLLTGCLGKWVSEANSQEVVCSKTQTQFLEERMSDIKTVHLVVGEPLDKFLLGVNEYRIQAKMKPLDADSLVVGELKNGNLAIALFKDKCFIERTDYVTTSDNMKAMFHLYKSADILKGFGDAV